MTAETIFLYQHDDNKHAGKLTLEETVVSETGADMDCLCLAAGSMETTMEFSLPL